MEKEKYVIKECKYHGLTKYIYVPSAKRYKCSKCQSEAVQKRRDKTKQILVEYKGGKCEICGYDKCISALEFHHINPEEKDFSFSDNTNRSWESTKQEIKKCILICANCHREIHAGLIDNNLSSSFNEDRALEIDNLVKSIKNKTVHYCKICGVEVWEKNSCCVKCAKLQ